MAYSSHISWQNATSPVPMEVYPSLAFDSLFENRGNRRNKSVLDRVKEQAASLRRHASAGDQSKLDEYLTSVREVEKRIERLRADQDKAGDRAKSRGTSLMTMERPDNGLPEDIREHMRLMCDIIAMAFQTDKTRVATLLLARDLGALIYPFIGVNQGHHGASHNNNSDGYERVARFHLSQLAYLATKLDSMPEGDGTVLDNSMILYGSALADGDRHEHENLPLLMAGRGGGRIVTGRHLRYASETPMCNLLLSMLNIAGVNASRHGDSTGFLRGLEG